MTLNLPWDAVVDPPATIAIIGGGPIGIEAAIYARFLGFFVSIFEQRRVGHRMLDWHDRLLSVPVSECTTPLGHAAIAAQDDQYKRPEADKVFTGKQYADEYLIPLAKCDLIFDDIHFLSPIDDVSRIRTRVTDRIDWQERCNDEFRVLVNGRHRGVWNARADIILDCRGEHPSPVGIGPGGGQAIGESQTREFFHRHAPLDRKFERKMLQSKRVVLVGTGLLACNFATEFCEQFGNDNQSVLTWLVAPEVNEHSDHFLAVRRKLLQSEYRNFGCIEMLGVEQIEKKEDATFHLRLLKDDDSTIELDCDVVADLSIGQCRPISTSLHRHDRFEPAIVASAYDAPDLSAVPIPDWLTNEPGYYRVRGGSIEDGPGKGLKSGFEQIRQVFAFISGRDDLDLYSIIEKQQSNQ